MNKKLIFAILITFLFLNISCEYEPKGVYMRDVVKNTKVLEINISELTLNGDTIFWYNNDQNVRFTFNPINGTTNEVNIFIDGILKYEYEKVSGIGFNPLLNDGEHLLKIEVIIGSGNGSIADKVGAEGSSFFKEFVIIVNKNFKPIPKATIINGYLKINLDKYLGSDILEYQVQKMDYESKTISINNNIYIDSLYVGEGMEYRFFVKNTKNQIISWGEILLKSELPKLNLNKANSNIFLVTWNKTKYFNAGKHYEIYRSNSPEQISSGSRLIKSIDDTLLIINDGYFGDNLTIGLKVIPKNENSQRNLSLPMEVKNTLIGVDIKERYVYHFSDLIKINNDEFIFKAYTGSSNYDSLYKFSISKAKIIDRKRFNNCENCSPENIKVSKNGKFMTFRNGSTGKHVFSETSNFDNHVTLDLKEYTGNNFVPPIPVSNDGIGLIRNSLGSILYNFKNNSKSPRFIYPYNFDYTLQISPNGKYFFYRDFDKFSIIKYDDDLIFKETIIIPNFSNNYYYDFDLESNFVYFNGTRFLVKNLESLKNVVEYNLIEKYLVDIDYFNNEILTFSSDRLKIKDLKTGKTLKEIPINFSPFNDNSCYLINGNIIKKNGIVLFK